MYNVQQIVVKILDYIYVLHHGVTRTLVFTFYMTAWSYMYYYCILFKTKTILHVM